MAQEARLRFVVLAPWLGTLARLVLAGVFFAAGASKVTDLAGSGRAVNAYQLMPFEMAKIVGAALPFMELTLALFLLAGLATRAVAALGAALLLGYIGGIASVWARGLSIDCGCFGTGGALPAGVHPSYLGDLLRDVALLLVAVFLAWRPRTRLGLDAVLLGEPPQASRNRSKEM
ncbi:MAG: hypothetical protein V7603_2190 [Micromonosporaceae bacterium]